LPSSEKTCEKKRDLQVGEKGSDATDSPDLKNRNQKLVNWNDYPKRDVLAENEK